MHSTVLLKIALTCSLIGIIGLFLLVDNAQIPEHDISHIKEMDDGSTIKTVGKIRSISTHGNLTFIDLERVETINVIAFDSSQLSLRLRQDDTVAIEGKIEEYNSETEIIADKIQKRNI